MKKVFLFISVAIIVNIGMSCSNDEPNTGIRAAITKEGTIHGKLKMYSYKYNYIDQTYEYVFKDNVSNEIDTIIAYYYNPVEHVLGVFQLTKGRFFITLPAPPSEKLINISEEYKYISEEYKYISEEYKYITISNDSAKVSYCSLDGVKNGEFVGYIRLIKSDLSVDMQVRFIYTNQDVIVKGTYTEEGYDYDQIVEYTYEYKLDLKEGWNTIVSNKTGTKTIYTSNNEPYDMLWILQVYR